MPKCPICGSYFDPEAYMCDEGELYKTHCFDCAYWLPKLGMQNAVILNGVHMVIAPEDESYMFRGFAGAKWVITWLDGTTTTTTNLWRQGKIDAHLLHLFPDNAISVEPITHS